MCMPGGRHLSTPTINSTAAAIDATSMNDRPSNQMSVPMPDCAVSVLRGGYMNQPPDGATPNRIDPHTKQPPMKKLQKPNADRRGNGRSRAPITAGISRIATASKIGTANRKIIAVPWSVKAWL